MISLHEMSQGINQAPVLPGEIWISVIKLFK